MGAAQARDSVLLELSNNVSASTTAETPETTTTDVPWDGRVTAVTLGWLSGADAQAGVQVGTDTGYTYIPYNTDELDGSDAYIASDDFTRTFDVSFPMQSDDTIEAKFINTDGTNSHLINVLVTYERDC